MVGLINLPEYSIPRNALLDTSGLNNAIDSNRQNALAQTHLGLQQQAGDRAERQMGMQEKAFAREQATTEARQAAGVVQSIQGMPGHQREAAWQQALQMPGFRDLPPEMRDFNRAAPLILSKAATYTDPLTRQKTEADIAESRAKTGLYGAQATAATQKDVVTNFILQQLQGGDQGAPAAPAGNPNIRPQSFNGAAPQSGGVQPVADMGGAPRNALNMTQPQQPYNDPNIIQTQAAAPQSQPQQQGPELVDTPLGRMTPDRARKLGFALALGNKGDAGKMMESAVDRDKLGKEARNQVDKTELEATNSLGKIRDIRASFDPKYLNTLTQGKMALTSLKAKFSTLKPEDHEELYKFATFRRDAAANVNAAIKANSGATVTEQELKRNLVELPNAGTGIFDGDDYATFTAKIDRAEDTLALGIARMRYLRSKGFTGDVNAASAQIPVEGMRDVINQRAKAIEAEVKATNPKLDQKIINSQVDKRVKQEFGI